MMEEGMLAHLARRIDEDIESTTEGLASGAAKDYAEYKYACGTVRGMLMSKNHIIELAQRLEHDDD